MDLYEKIQIYVEGGSLWLRVTSRVDDLVFIKQKSHLEMFSYWVVFFH